MAWRRKGTRYRWGVAAENELRKHLHQYIAANCRSSRSGGLLDVWAIGKNVWLFQVKRGRITKAAATRLLKELHESIHLAGVPDSVVHIYVANRFATSNKRIGWAFYYF